MSPLFVVQPACNVGLPHGYSGDVSFGSAQRRGERGRKGWTAPGSSQEVQQKWGDKRGIRHFTTFGGGKIAVRARR